jgi:GH43 family beta-xylosidase
MTYVEDGGRSYVIWSQRYITDHIGDAELWIATIDPADPWRLTSDPVRIVTAEFGWDHEVAEGAFALRHGDRLVVTYSGSAVGPTYAVGAIEARSGADLLDPTAWAKANAPVLGTRSPRAGGARPCDASTGPPTGTWYSTSDPTRKWRHSCAGCARSSASLGPADPHSD